MTRTPLASLLSLAVLGCTPIDLDARVQTSADFVLVEGGEFSMGSPLSVDETAEQFGGSPSDWMDEHPLHAVRVESFLISPFETTFSQYDLFVADTGRRKPNAHSWGRGERPVIHVSWFDAVEYCNWLSENEGLSSAYSIQGENVEWDASADGYRLPTEAEWEYAATGGQLSEGYVFSGSNELESVGWFQENSSDLGRGDPDYGTHEVGELLPNKLGLYDLSGNVYEWCWDWYQADYYEGSPSESPAGPDETPQNWRANRGGAWNNLESVARSANRHQSAPDWDAKYLGFRVVRSVFDDD